MFSAFGAVQFRRSSSDGIAMMALLLGDRDAYLPLNSVRREFGIAPGTPDDQMLDLIEASLDFVASLKPGDPLPDEVRTGEASWKPNATHARIAMTRMRLNLIDWLSPGSRWSTAERDDATLTRLAVDTGLWAEVQAVATVAARRLKLHDGGAVVVLMDEMARELSYIEALRERLLRRVELLCRRIARLLRDRRGPAIAFENLSQIHRHSVASYRQIASRFNDVDVQTSEADTLLRNAASQRSFIRSNRDWLYRNQREWSPLLDRWDEQTESDQQGALLADTYRFLAPKSMPTHGWQPARHSQRVAAKAQARMTW